MKEVLKENSENLDLALDRKEIINLDETDYEFSVEEIEEKLKELKSLYDKKLISKPIYDRKQKEILGRF